MTAVYAEGRADGSAKLTGRAVYAGDVRLSGMLYAALVRSPYPRARIVRIRTEAARALPGVHAVLTGEDIRFGLYGRRVRDMPVLARGVVRYVGERVAAVAAETPQLAQEAARLVEVEYEPLAAVLDPEEALAPDAPRVHEAPWRYPGAVVHPDDHPNVQSRRIWAHGEDVEAVLRRCHRVFEGVFRLPPAHQGYLEPHACVVRITETGRIEVWASNKSPHRLRAQLSACLGVPEDRIRIQPVYVGGDFGGKGSPMDVPVCVALAEATGRPVKLCLSYGEELSATNPRHDGVIRVRLGINEQGDLQALDLRAILNGGAYAAFKPVEHINLNGIREAGNCYQIPAVRIESVIAYTHTVPRGHMRSPGSLEANFAVESLLDEAARELGMDPVAFRIRNLLRPKDTGTLGETWVEFRGAEVLEAALQALRQPPEEEVVPEGDWARGTGVALYARAAHAGETEVALKPQLDGSVVVWVPFPEQGGGQHTVVRNVVQRELGLPAQLVHVQQASTDELVADAGVGGSRVTISASAAVAHAVHALRQRLAELGLWTGPEEVRQALAALARRYPDEVIRARFSEDHLPPLASCCVQIARVRVDRRTGGVRVDEILTAVDVADVLNPPSHLAQIEGGVVMGLGAALLEALPVEEGRVMVANLDEYRIPSVEDVPRLQVVLVPGARGAGPYNVKPVGELTNVAVAAAIANAVADAVGVRVASLPITAEKVFWGLRSGQRWVW